MAENISGTPISPEEYKKVTEELYKQNLEVVRLYKQVEELNHQLEEANKGQADLLHIINHQIKGYMTKARYVFDALLNDKDYGQVPEAAKGIVKEGYNSVTEGVEFVTDFLTASNIEKGTYTYQIEPVDFKAVVEEMSRAMEQTAKEKGLAYELKMAPGEYKMTGDKAQLGQAIRNLIDNSIKYTPHGSLAVSLERKDNKVLFKVKDTGVGLSNEVKPKLFTKGGRDRNSQKINVDSTGFGLAFVKGVVEAHKGRVWAESPGVGKGSTFYMEIPLS
jgi:signal transduction histidine kinase